MISIEDIRAVLGDVLQIGKGVLVRRTLTPLLGSIPIVNFMTAVTVITMREERSGIVADCDEISADTSETLNTLLHFANAKLAA